MSDHYEVNKPEDLKGELATINELHEFIDKVRALVGVSPLADLAPSVPNDAHACLIANNIGTSVHVDGDGDVSGFWPSGAYKWYLHFDELTEEDVALIGERLGLEHEYSAVMLPERIGNVALAFDSWSKNPKAWPKFDEFIDAAYKSERLGDEEVTEYAGR